jgi:hypothetical protein
MEERASVLVQEQPGRARRPAAQLDSTTKLGRAELPLGRPTGRSALPDSGEERKPGLDRPHERGLALVALSSRAGRPAAGAKILFLSVASWLNPD